MAEQKFPFIFLNHGAPRDTYSFQGEKNLIIWFKTEITEKLQKKIEKLCPKPLRQMFSWGKRQMYNYSISDELYIFEYYTAKVPLDMSGVDFHNKKSSEAFFLQAYQAFADDIEQWALKINELSPIEFLVSLSSIGGSEWDKWSKAQLDFIKQIMQNFENQADINPSEKMILQTTKSFIHKIK